MDVDVVGSHEVLDENESVDWGSDIEHPLVGGGSIRSSLFALAFITTDECVVFFEDLLVALTLCCDGRQETAGYRWGGPVVVG